MDDFTERTKSDVAVKEKRGRRGPTKTTSEEERRKQNRLRQKRFQEKKRDNAKAMAFALAMIGQVDKRKSRSNKGTLMDFLQFLQGLKESTTCTVEDNDGNTCDMDFEKLRDSISKGDDIYKIT